MQYSAECVAKFATETSGMYDDLPKWFEVGSKAKYYIDYLIINSDFFQEYCLHFVHNKGVFV